MEPITEQRQVPGPVMYGYLLTAAASPARRAALTRCHPRTWTRSGASSKARSRAT
jgi:hypothetical protein